jgi:hypothetical protein
MKKTTLFVVFILTITKVFPQENALYQTGVTAEQNLNAIGNLLPYTPGGIGFDNRYEGTKGSPRLFDKLLPSLVKLKGQDFYLQLETNIDLIRNVLIFSYPKTGQMLVIPYDKINEVKIKNENKELIFRTSKWKNPESDFKEHRFFQVLKEGQYQFIKIPVKKFVAGDYKDVYGSDRRYDEYITYYKYYIMNADSTFQRIQLNKKSLVKMFPGKKDIIISTAESKSYDNDEEMVTAILDKL